MVVKQEFEKEGLKPVSILLGEVELNSNPTSEQLAKIQHGLRRLGFEILDDQRKQQIENIKTLFIEKLQSGEIEEHFNLSDFISKKLNKEYSQISRLFSEVEGITVEQFFILQKIEKVKEWLIYDELTLSEIAWKLGYSSVSHLSTQFKKITGMTPTDFKRIGSSNRKSLDQV
jgi:AraC-like DNA-binding protein